MSNERDELAKVLQDAANPSCPIGFWSEAYNYPTGYGKLFADALITAGYWKPRTITTTAEVDALPDHAVAITCYGDAVTIYRDNPGLPPEHFHFLVEGRAATVLYEPEPQP